MERRKFIAQSGLLAANLLVPEWLTATQITNVGLQLYSLREDMKVSAKDVIQKVAKFGYKEVEGYGYGGDFWGMSAKIFKNYLDDLGITMPSFHFITGRKQEGITYSLSSNLEKICEDANKVGVKYIVCPWIHDLEYATVDEVKALCEFFNITAERIKSMGLSFAYHNHSFEFKPIGEKLLYDHLLDMTDPNLVKFEMDLYWLYHGDKTPFDYFEKYPGRFHLVHIKDMDKQNRDKNVIIGKGAIDFKSIFKKAQQAGIKHYYYEQETYEKSPMECAKESFKYLSKLSY